MFICFICLHIHIYMYICTYVCNNNKKEKGAINFGGSKGNMGRVKKKKGEVMWLNFSQKNLSGYKNQTNGCDKRVNR